MSNLEAQDPEVHELIKLETQRQQTKLSMIPSENFFSKAVREATGSVLSHKYAEGNIGRRYYEGNKFIDKIEKLTIERAKQAFNLPPNWSANVQTLSGSTANLSVYLALLNIGDYIMGLYLPDGGHLSHGWSYTPKVPADPNKTVYYGGKQKVNISSKIFNTISYKTDPKTQLLDYDEIERIALLQKPKLIITGGTAYPREIDYQRMKQIADKVGAFYLADIAHEAGLIAAGAMNSPVGIADVVTMTTHKTLRSGRGAIILAHEDTIKKINKAVLPGLLGGPFNHSIAGICVGLKETQTDKFKEYAFQTVKNAKHLAEELAKFDFKIISKGTDKHLILIDLTNKPLLGKKFARALDHAGIVANYNTIPQETKSPLNPSGLRLGTPWITGRGMKEAEISKIALLINQVMKITEQYKDLKFKDFKEAVSADIEIQKIANEVKVMCEQFPLDM
ncbi:serine hydroxymethyltransferase [archaeon]|nr:serine hydroxymethyltransferase [archaeon]|tara:strand:- start:2600 stop:3949 length:1350 start_codon:yes stop_codon:yes gene_type:complete